MRVTGRVKSMAKGPYVTKMMVSLKTGDGQWNWSVDGKCHEVELNKKYPEKGSRMN